MDLKQIPLLNAKDTSATSVFRPENMLREARRQKNLGMEPIPEICVLDPDGDLVRQLRATGRLTSCAGWACYHTQMFAFVHEGIKFGIVGCAVGSAFAVLIAEQAFASGCRLLISITSAGQITPRGLAPYFVLIDLALRDEGTSYHYLPPARFVAADPALIAPAMAALAGAGVPVYQGAAWTTDAPFRETQAAIDVARTEGILAVEMEAAALYAFAQACGRDVLCFAHVTNLMAQIEGDFGKGEADGTHDALAVLVVAARALTNTSQSPRARLFAQLDELGIDSTTLPYPAHQSVEEGKALRGEMAGQFTKNLLLRDKKNALFLVVAGEDRNIDLRTLHTSIGAQGRLGFAPAAQMETVLGVTPGALTPFAIVNDTAAQVRVVIDADLLDAKQVNFHPLVNTETTGIRPDDLIRFIRSFGREPIMLKLLADPPVPATMDVLRR
ncbi:MAG TPA: YbaK/EbsC family protein [Acidiphilium sp.]|nr:YbaK/EbsC family protein [Acidiphilium sp.]